MRLWWAIPGLVAAGILLALLTGPAGPPGDAEVQRRLLAHPEMAPYNRSNATIGRIAPGDLPGLAASQPAIYGNISASPLLYRVEFRGAGGEALVIYDAGSDRIVRVFNLLRGRLG